MTRAAWIGVAVLLSMLGIGAAVAVPLALASKESKKAKADPVAD